MVNTSHRPIFVVGAPRSGTTLLQQMLHAHRNIAVAPETHVTMKPYERRLTFGDLSRAENRRRLGEWLTRTEQIGFRKLGLDADMIVEQIVRAPPTLGSVLATVFRAYARQHGKGRWGDKRPGHIQKVPKLRRMFPDAQFVHLIRDGRDAVSSLNAMPWYGGDLYTAILTWRDAVDTGRRLAAGLGPDGYFELRYEDLVTATERELTKLCAFLGEDFDPAMLESHRLARRQWPRRRAWHRRTYEAANDQRVGAWADRFEPWEAGVVEHTLRARLADHAYEPAPVPGPAASARVRLRRAAMRRWSTRRRRAIRETYARLREPNPVVSHLTGTPITERPTAEMPTAEPADPFRP